LRTGAPDLGSSGGRPREIRNRVNVARSDRELDSRHAWTSYVARESERYRFAFRRATNLPGGFARLISRWRADERWGRKRSSSVSLVNYRSLCRASVASLTQLLRARGTRCFFGERAARSRCESVYGTLSLRYVVLPHRGKRADNLNGQAASNSAFYRISDRRGKIIGAITRWLTKVQRLAGY